MDQHVLEALRVVTERFRTPAEVDLFVQVFRRGPSDAEQLASSTGLRVSHAEQVAERLVTSGAIVRTGGAYEVDDDVRPDAAVVSAVFDRYRHRLVDAVVALQD